jgi:hypothetical protein
LGELMQRNRRSPGPRIFQPEIPDIMRLLRAAL